MFDVQEGAVSLRAEAPQEVVADRHLVLSQEVQTLIAPLRCSALTPHQAKTGK